MWMRASKREIRITLGIRSNGGVMPADDGLSTCPRDPFKLPDDLAAALGSSSSSTGSGRLGSVVELKASTESADRMEKALAKLVAQDNQTREFKRKEGQAKGKGANKGKDGRPTGPYLERTRVTDKLVTGAVDEWKGKFGWIKPHKPVNHKMAKAHKGRLYIHSIDLEWWVDKLTPGSICRFHVYSDANSLGVEECTEIGRVDESDAAWGMMDLHNQGAITALKLNASTTVMERVGAGRDENQESTVTCNILSITPNVCAAA